MGQPVLRIMILLALAVVAVACTTSDTADAGGATTTAATGTTSAPSSTTTAQATTTSSSTTTVLTTTTLAPTTTTSSSTTTTSTTTATTTTQAQVVRQVNMGKNENGYFYSPGNVSIPVGGNVVWVNKDDEDHDVQSGTPVTCDGLFCSGTITPDSAYSFTFTAPGTYPYFCLLHPGLMSGTITVTDE